MSPPDASPSVSTTKPAPSALRRALISLRRIGLLLLSLLLVLGSLLTFPAGMAGMVAVWLGLYAALVLLGRRGWPALTGCTLVVLVKRVDWPPGLWLFLAAALVAIIADWRSSGAASPAKARRLRAVLTAFLWLAWLGLAWDWRRSGHANHAVAALDGRPIVCIGDSLTSYPPHGGYPKFLGRMVAVPVVNLGEPGVTSAEALKQLPKLKAARPQAVVIELGGHDFLKDPSWLKSGSRAATKRNLETLIAAARALHAEVVLIEIPRDFIVDPFAGLERELAREYDLELISDTPIRNFVLWSRSCPPGAWTDGPYLSDDGLHPNAHGDEYLSSVVLESLVRLFGPKIRADRGRLGR
jgi:lysophospholipase L1-like esterase